MNAILVRLTFCTRAYILRYFLTLGFYKSTVCRKLLRYKSQVLFLVANFAK
jgi:hypothetical protein